MHEWMPLRFSSPIWEKNGSDDSTTTPDRAADDDSDDEDSHFSMAQDVSLYFRHPWLNFPSLWSLIHLLLFVLYSLSCKPYHCDPRTRFVSGLYMTTPLVSLSPDAIHQLSRDPPDYCNERERFAICKTTTAKNKK